MALRCGCSLRLRLRAPVRAPLFRAPSLAPHRPPAAAVALWQQQQSGHRAASALAEPRSSADVAAAQEQRANSRELQQLLEKRDGGGARALLVRLLREGSAQPHHVTAVLRGACREREELAAVAEHLDEAMHARLASKLHNAWLAHRDFKQAAAALACGVRAESMPLEAASKIAVRALRTMQRRRARAAAQRAYVNELSKSDGLGGPLPYAYAALFAAADGSAEVKAAAIQIQHELAAGGGGGGGGGSERLRASASMDEPGGEVAWLALHQAWVRVGRGHEAAAALALAMPPGAAPADCERQAASATNAVVKLLAAAAGNREGRPAAASNRSSRHRKRKRRGQHEALRYLAELGRSEATAGLLCAAHFNPVAQACASHEEVAELLAVMAEVDVQADVTTFATLQDIGLKLGDGRETAEALQVAVLHGALCPHQAGEIAANSLSAALRGSEEVARLQGWAYYQALAASASTSSTLTAGVSSGSSVALPTRFFNVLLGAAWRGIDVVGKPDLRKLISILKDVAKQSTKEWLAEHVASICFVWFCAFLWRRYLGLDV